MKKIKKIVIVTTVILLIFVYVGCAQEPIPSSSPTPTPLPEDLLTFIWTTEVIDTAGITAEKLYEGSINNERVTKAEINKDGSMTITVTKKQQQMWIDDQIEAINNYTVQWENIGKDYGKEYYIKTNDDLSEVRFGWDGEMMRKDPEIMIISFTAIQVSMLLYQIFSGVDPEKCSVHVIFEHYKTGEEVLDFLVPQDNGGKFTESIWD